MFNKNFILPLAIKSAILDYKNRLFEACQNTKIARVISESFMFKNIDRLIFAALLATFASAPFLTTGGIGFFTLLFVFLVIFKLFFQKGEKIIMTPLDGAIAVFYAVSILSLMGSTLFVQSFHGFLKVLTYTAFYFCLTHWLRQHRGKIPFIFALIGALVCFESAVGILQNFAGVEEISGWQDTSRLDITEVISRSYGTLQPFNPNLLGGYLLPGLSFLFYFAGLNLLNSQKKRTIIFTALIFLTILTIIYTGCRGAYLGIIMFFALCSIAAVYRVNSHYGGFANIKKRWKNAVAIGLVGFSAFIFTNPAILKRIFSIFAFREDSSISFRLNVYKASFAMFLDNPIFGVGLGNQNFREIYGLYMMTGFDALGAYSVPLEIAVETGVLGLISFGAILVIAFLQGLKILKSAQEGNKLLVFSMLMLIALLMTHGLIDTIFYRPQVQMLFYLALATINVFYLPSLEPHQNS